MGRDEIAAKGEVGASYTAKLLGNPVIPPGIRLSLSLSLSLSLPLSLARSLFPRRKSNCIDRDFIPREYIRRIVASCPEGAFSFGGNFEDVLNKEM